MLARDTLSNGDYALAGSMLRRLIDLAPTHTQAASAESYAYPEGQHSVFEQTQSPLRAS
jgi:Flp pilus assembly protein TadD